MIFVAFTGMGWLSYAFVPLIFAVGAGVGLGLDDGPQPKYVGAIIAGIVIAVVGAAVQWLVGRALNGATTDHTTYDIPMELVAPFYPVCGLVMVAFGLGAATSPLVGLLVFAAALVPAWLLVQAYRRRNSPESPY